MTPEELEDGIARAGERLAKADAERASAIAQLRELARQAHGVVPIKRIAELGGVTRPTVYKMLED